MCCGILRCYIHFLMLSTLPHVRSYPIVRCHKTSSFHPFIILQFQVSYIGSLKQCIALHCNGGKGRSPSSSSWRIFTDSTPRLRQSFSPNVRMLLGDVCMSSPRHDSPRHALWVDSVSKLQCPSRKPTSRWTGDFWSKNVLLKLVYL